MTPATRCGWKQGDIVEVGRTLFWFGPGGEDPITGQSGTDPAADRTLITARQPEGTGLAVITSQTCDVIGTGPGAKQPWVQVSPICKITDPNAIASVTDRRLQNHFLVTGLGEDGCFAVDLRLSQPISKAILVTQTPRPAFDEALLPLFGEQLASKVGRVSLHDLLSYSLAKALGELIEREQKMGTWPAYVEQFRIGIRKGTPLQPLEFYLLVVTDAHANADVTKKIGKCFTGWKRANREALRAKNLVARDPQIRHRDKELDIPTYRDTFHLAIPGVTTRFWH